MRPKFVALVVGVAIAAIVGLALLRAWQNGPNDGSASAAAEAARKTSAGRISGGIDKTPQGSNSGTSTTAQATDVVASNQAMNMTSGQSVAKSSPPEGMTHEEYVEQRVGQLMDLGMRDDPAALKTILSEINNPEGEIRKAAIEAVKQFGSADAVPKLEEALSSTETAADKQDLRDAIEFLKLPSFLAKRN